VWGGSAARFSSELGEKASGTVYGPKTPMLLNGDPRNGVLACSRRTAVLARVAPAVESVLCPGEEGAERESSPPLRGRRL